MVGKFVSSGSGSARASRSMKISSPPTPSRVSKSRTVVGNAAFEICDCCALMKAIDPCRFRYFLKRVALLMMLACILPAMVARAENSMYRVSENGRYLVDNKGSPFFWQGDSEWELLYALSAQDAKELLHTRRVQGFTVVQAMCDGMFPKWIAPDTQAAADLAMRVIDQWKDRMKFQVINLPFCFMPGYERFLMGDMLKPYGTAAIVGGRNPQQVEGVWPAANFRLTREEYEEINAFLAAHP